ncbi:InlB B-repeat-containing protein, partial [Faecalibaculum rodentium]
MDNQAERPGYQFAGWYVDEARTKRINPGGKLPSAITLYDKWIPILYPVSYDMNGGTNSRKNPQFISVESGVISLHPARKPGYRFDSWILEG